MSTGHITARNRRRTPSIDLFDRAPEQTAINDKMLHAKYRAVVMVRIGLRPGNNLDILEMLGLIPTEVTR